MEILEIDDYNDQGRTATFRSSSRPNCIYAAWCFLISILAIVSLNLQDEDGDSVIGGLRIHSMSDWVGRDYRNDNKLQLVFHVGPAKMGSTSIQLGAIQNYYQELTSKDRYVVYNSKDASDLNHCLARNMTQCMSQKDKEWTKFVRFMKNAKHNRRHVLISTENYWSHIMMDVDDNESLLSPQHGARTEHAHHSFLLAYSNLLLNELDYNVTIVFGYRPLYEYWTSWYYQTYRQFCGYAHEIVESRRIPTLANYLDQTNRTFGLVHPTQMGLNHFSVYFSSSGSSNFVILPLGPNLISRFLCEAVVGATHACQAAVSDANDQEHQQVRYNLGHTLVYDRIAQAARSQGVSHKSCKTLVEKLQSLTTVTNKTEQEKSWTNVFAPLVCLSPGKQAWFLQKTIQYHTELVLSKSVRHNVRIVSGMDGVDTNGTSSSSLFVTPPASSIMSIPDLTAQFQRAANTTLCDVDVDFVVKNWSTLWIKDNDNHTR